jgi:hypothetical protein
MSSVDLEVKSNYKINHNLTRLVEILEEKKEKNGVKHLLNKKKKGNISKAFELN